MPVEIRYRLSFTSGDLLHSEAHIAVPLFLSKGDWKLVRAKLEEENLLQTRTLVPSKRRSREITKRLKVLSVLIGIQQKEDGDD